jgi:hypothetical protein
MLLGTAHCMLLGVDRLTNIRTHFGYKPENQENQNKVHLYPTYIFIEIF